MSVLCQYEVRAGEGAEVIKDLRLTFMRCWWNVKGDDSFWKLCATLSS